MINSSSPLSPPNFDARVVGKKHAVAFVHLMSCPAAIGQLPPVAHRKHATLLRHAP